MNSFLDMAPKYLSAHKKKTRLAILGIVLSVALVVGIFSMIEVFLQYEKLQIIHDQGNYHIAVKNVTEDEELAISSRIDVKNSGLFKEFGQFKTNGISCELGAVAENFAGNIGVNVIMGLYPVRHNEIMLEEWACDSLYLNTGVGEMVSITTADGTTKDFIVSGICSDWAYMKASGIPAVFLSMDYANTMKAKASILMVEFKNRVNIRKAEQEIMSSLGIAADRVGENNHLLAVIGQSDHKAAIGIYQTGAILFLIVLVAGVVMIYNTFNISVMERIRQFGLLRCVGASKAQIRKLVKREGTILLVWALPFGVLLGMVATLFCCAILKFYSNIFSDAPLFYLSWGGILAGLIVGVFTVSIAVLLPAKKAASVSPLNAVTGSSDLKVPKTKKQGILTRLFPVETAMGIGNAMIKKKTLVLMATSIALSIIMFLGFNVLIGFMYKSLKTTKPYTPDISLVSEAGLRPELYSQLDSLDGARNVYGRMFGYVDATFDASRLTELYRQETGGVEVTENGLFDPPEKSWLISYDENQLKWARTDLLEGDLSEEGLNEHNGIIAVLQNIRKGVSSITADLQLGDKVYVETEAGTREYTVMAILRNVPFSDSNLNLATFITTEKQFVEITGQETYKAIDIQLEKKNQETTIAEIKQMIGTGITYLDSRQKNSETDQTFVTMAVFVYGFVVVIALISILNIISTMNTSVVARTKYLGVLRAVGMSGRQLDKMIAAEAATYGITGCVAGCILGVLLQKALISNVLTAIRIAWKFPLMQVLGVLIVVLLVTGLSIINPLKRIKEKGISEVIGSL